MSGTNWLVGSVRLASNATLVVNASNRTVDAGTYYLRDATSSLSLIAELQTEIAAVVPGSTVYISRDRKLRISSGGGALTLTVPAALQAVTGLPGSPTPSTLIVADAPSTLLWSPTWRGTPQGVPLGVDAREIDDAVQTISPTGATVRTTVHATQSVNAWAWPAVPQERVWTTGELGGEFVRFAEDVLRTGRRWKFYDSIDEDDASATAVTWTTAQGPYITPIRDAVDWYKRMVATLDTWANITINGVLTSEHVP
jgi:hypothetical protein